MATVRLTSPTGEIFDLTYTDIVRVGTTSPPPPPPPTVPPPPPPPTVPPPPPPPTGSKPGLSNTGPTNRAAITTTRTTDIQARTTGQIIENIAFVNAGIQFYADNVIVRNCTFADHPTPFYTSPNGSGPRRGIRIENCDVVWANPGKRNGTCVVGEGMSFYRCAFHGARDSDWCNNGRFMVVEGCWFYDIGLSGVGAHLDIYQWIGNSFGPLSVTFQGNFFDLPTTGDPFQRLNAIIFTNDLGLKFNSNWVRMGAGAGFAIQFSDPAQSNGAEVNDNVFETWGAAPIRWVSGNGWQTMPFNGNKVIRNGTLQAFEKTGLNSDLFKHP